MAMVSIVMACLNGEKFLGSAINSILSQDFNDWELIYVDDGSTDGSLELARNYSLKNGNIIVLQTSGRKGVSFARNLGSNRATGRYICFLDCDDWWHKNKLSIQTNYMIRNNIAFSCSSYFVTDSNGEIIRMQHSRPPLNFERLENRICAVGCLTVMFEKNEFKNFVFKSELNIAEDYMLWLEMLKYAEMRGLRVKAFDEPLATYRVHFGGSSRNKIKNLFSIYHVYRHISKRTIWSALLGCCRYIIMGVFDRFSWNVHSLKGRLGTASLIKANVFDFQDDLVSVIMPCYNGEKYISKAIESVLVQSYKNWELVIIDDGSSDQSVNKVQEYAAKDNRIKAFFNEGRKGASGARNFGLDKAQGRLVAFLDCDDWWDKDKLVIQIEKMKDTGAAFCCSEYRVCNSEGKIVRFQKVHAPLNFLRLFFKINTIGCLTVMVDRKEILDLHFPTNLKFSEDFVAWLNILAQLENKYCFGTIVEQPLATYRVLSTGKSYKKVQKGIGQWHLYRQQFQLSWLTSALAFGGYVFNVTRDRFSNRQDMSISKVD